MHARHKRAFRRGRPRDPIAAENLIPAGTCQIFNSHRLSSTCGAPRAPSIASTACGRSLHLAGGSIGRHLARNR